MKTDTAVTLGLDLGDRSSAYCACDADGLVVAEGLVSTEAPALQALAARFDVPWTMEAGTHSPWVDRLLTGMGLTVVVVNPRRLKMVSDSLKKTDRSDAALLALLGLFNPKLLWRVRHRSFDAQLGLTALKARDRLVRTRTDLVNTIRGLVKSLGWRLPACDAKRFHELRDQVPEELHASLHPMFAVLAELADQIAQLDARLEDLAGEHPVVARLRTVTGVGPVTALAYVLVLDDPERFEKSRQVGAYLGLTPRIDQSGATDKQLRITKAGDKLLRRLLVQCAQTVLRSNSRDSALKQWGLGLAERGGRAAKKKAVLAVARKLAVLLHRLWVTEEPYCAFPTVTHQTLPNVA